nr:tannase/feruloyl esterase family alpha/beta hydrolase [Novosphingobium sp. SG707]
MRWRTVFIAISGGSLLGAASPCWAKGGSAAQEVINPADKCSALAVLTLRDGRVTQVSHRAASAGQAGFCEVHATVAPEHDVIVRLPDRWRGRYVQFGGGGFDGFIPSVSTPSSGIIASGHNLAEEGYAVAVSNGGHRREHFAQGSFSSDRGLSLSYATAKIFDTDQVSQQLIEAYYGSAASYRYFAGCSNGGKNASVAAAYFSGQYDGVIGGDGPLGLAGDEAGGGDLTGYTVKWIDTFQQGMTISPAIGNLIYAEQLRQCDGLDGLKDGIIADPARCARQLDLSVLSCKPGGGSALCLSPQDLAVIARRRQPYRLNGKVVGAPWGIDNPGETGGPEVAAANVAIAFHLASPVELDRFPVAESYADIAAGLDGVYHMTGGLDAVARYIDQGGKLMLFHGWEDTGVPPQGSVDFYRKLRQVATVKGRDNARLYMVPGMKHCRGGNGADSAELLPVMARWVEEVIAPGSPNNPMLAWKRQEGVASGDVVRNRLEQSVMSRPLCAYPLVAIYKGGAVMSHHSFVCRKD